MFCGQLTTGGVKRPSPLSETSDSNTYARKMFTSWCLLLLLASCAFSEAGWLQDADTVNLNNYENDPQANYISANEDSSRVVREATAEKNKTEKTDGKLESWYDLDQKQDTKTDTLKSLVNFFNSVARYVNGLNYKRAEASKSDPTVADVKLKIAQAEENIKKLEEQAKSHQ